MKHIIDELNNVFNECSEENWDGYKATPVSKCVYSNVKKLLSMIPPSFPEPDILPEPDGSICLEWHEGPNISFMVSVNGTGNLYYAGLFGERKISGKEYFSETVPKVIINNLMYLFPKT